MDSFASQGFSSPDRRVGRKRDYQTVDSLHSVTAAQSGGVPFPSITVDQSPGSDDLRANLAHEFMRMLSAHDRVRRELLASHQTQARSFRAAG